MFGARRYAATLVLLIVSCSGGPGSTVDGFEDFNAKYLEAVCAHLVGCGEYESDSVCREVLSPAFAVEGLSQRIEAGLVVFDHEQADACLGALQDVSCIQSAAADVFEAECARIFTGTIADGQACTHADECASGRCRVPACDDACCPGACEFRGPPPAAVGETCDLIVPCQRGAFCRDDIETCIAQLEAGSSCDADLHCLAGLVCRDGVCDEPPRLGEPCSSGSCGRLGLRCDYTDTCVAAGFGGEACDPLSDLCGGLLQCAPASSTCASPPTVGEPCHGACGIGSFCGDVDPITLAGTCIAPRPDGAPCSSGGECEGRVCSESGTCAAVCGL